MSPNEILPIATQSSTFTQVVTITGLERLLVFEALAINLLLILLGLFVIIKTLFKNGLRK